MILERFPNVDINQTNDIGVSPFKVACEKNHPQIIKYLLENVPKCDPNLESKALVTPLMTAIQYGSAECVELLCDSSRGVKILGVHDKWGKDALDYTAYYGEIFLFNTLLRTLLKRKNITTWDELKQSGFLSLNRVNDLLELATKCKNNGFMAFMAYVKDSIIKPKKFDVLKALVNIKLIDKAYESSYFNFMKNLKMARYLFQHCKKSTLKDISSVINRGITNQECGFDDSLLLLAQMVDPAKLALSIEQCTQMCLSTDTKTEKSDNFFKNNLLNSNIWITKVNSNFNDANNQPCADVNDNVSDEKSDASNDTVYVKTKKPKDKVKEQGEMLFDRVRHSVIQKELELQKKFIKHAIVEEEKHNEQYWKELRTTIKNFNLGKGGKIRLFETYSQYDIKTDLMDGKGIKPEYDKKSLTIDAQSGFDGITEYDFHGYLSKLLITAHAIDPQFQKQCKKLFTRQKLGVRCTYTPAPVKTKQRSQKKAELDYHTHDFPNTGSLLDLIRCSVVFENVKDLIQACVKFGHIVDREKKGGIIARVLRIKNGFSKINDQSWNVELNKFEYADIKFNVLIKTDEVSFVGEIQFLLKFMLIAKKKQHSIYGFVRNETFFNELANIVYNNDCDEKEKQIKTYILSENMSNWSKFLETALPFDKKYIFDNKKNISECLAQNSWDKGRRLLQQTVLSWEYDTSSS